MAYWQLGQKEEARRWFEKTVDITEAAPANTPDRQAWDARFRAEAAQLLGISDKLPTAKQKPKKPR